MNYKSEDGYTFIIVIWAIVILSFIFLSLFDEIFLERYLVEYEINQKNIRQTELSVLERAISILNNDEIKEYDAVDNQWAKVVNNEINNIKYQIEIKDYGSKLNINFLEVDKLKEKDWWQEEVEILMSEGLIEDLFLLKDI